MSAGLVAVEELILSDIPAGTLLDARYVVRGKIADGSFASVYRAEDTLGGGTVALKVLDPLRGADPVGRLRFEREFAALSRVSHPSVARCHALGADAGLDFLVLELIEGETLAEHLAHGRLSVAAAVSIAHRLAEALDACHQVDVLHRDLTPTNIVLHAERGPVILDFGSAWFSSAANLTRTGALIGSPQYLAPEVFASSMIDARADVYSLGAILFEMLTGRPVHLSSSVAELAILHQSAEPPSALALRPELGSALASIVDRAIAPRAEDRFATARELADALERRRELSRSPLEPVLACTSCRTPAIIDLPFCPGCGAEVSWDLASGDYAVQLTSISNVARALSWLTDRYADVLPRRSARVLERLLRPPVPLVASASRATANQLAAEARDAGCTAEVIRARAVIGARLRARDATKTELVFAALLHFVLVIGLGVMMILLGFGLVPLVVLPMIVGVLQLGVVRSLVRRPLLRPKRRKQKRDEAESAREERIRARLAKLGTDRGRRLAAAAIARAAPLLLEQRELPDRISLHIRGALDDALEAASVLDAQAAYLRARSRSKLAVEMTAARSRIAQGDLSGSERLLELEAERDELTEASIAHDLAARRALEACQAITDALVLAVDA